MAVMNFGGVEENVVTREEFPLEKAREVFALITEKLSMHKIAGLPEITVR